MHFGSESLIAFRKAVAYPRLAEQMPRMARILFQLFSQLADVNSQVFDIVGVLDAPHFAQQAVMR
jgi:hypothetical protein